MKQAREAQAQYLERQEIFRERVAQGFYRKALNEELAKYREVYDAGCQLAGKLEAAIFRSTTWHRLGYVL
jgi:hypothetical protein